MIAHIYPSVLEAVSGRGYAGCLETGVFRATGVRLCTILDMNFYEKALFVKPTWRPALCGVNANCLYPSRYASIRTSVSPLFCGSVHRMRSVVSASTRRCCNLRSGLPPGR
jgi:hypothetical protein